jgi:hypothetical protein
MGILSRRSLASSPVDAVARLLVFGFSFTVNIYDRVFRCNETRLKRVG